MDPYVMISPSFLMSHINMQPGQKPLPTPPLSRNPFLPSHSNPYQYIPALQPIPERPLVRLPHIAATSQDLRHQRDESFRGLTLGPITRPDDGVDILVESDGKEQAFTVHRRLLCHFSPYFRKLFADKKPTVKSMKVKVFSYNNELDFDDDQDEIPEEHDEIEVEVVIKLPFNNRSSPKIPLPKELGAVKPHVFGALVEWLYRAYPGHAFPPPGSPINASTLIELWVLAAHLKIPACQNDCISGIERFRKQTNVIETGMIEWVYENTAHYPRGTCGLKNLVLDQCAWILDEKWLLGGIGEKDNEAMFPRECLVDLVARLRFLLREGHAQGEMGALEFMEQRKGRYWVEEIASKE